MDLIITLRKKQILMSDRHIDTFREERPRKDFMDGTNRDTIRQGQKVAIVLKQDQRTGNLTEGVVQNILTNSSYHPHGIKVRLMNGSVGRVKKIL
jgi:uncharacterized repeat protein (TIGR03833 family)